MARLGGDLIQARTAVGGAVSTGQATLTAGASDSLHQDFTAALQGQPLSILFQHSTTQSQFEINTGCFYTHSTRAVTRPTSSVVFGTNGAGASTDFASGSVIVSVVQSWRDMLDLWAELPSPVGLGTQTTITSAALIDDLALGDVTTLREKYRTGGTLTGVQTGSSPAYPQRQADGWITVVANGTTTASFLRRAADTTLVTGPRWLITVLMDVDTTGNWGGEATLFTLGDFANGYGARLRRSGTSVLLSNSTGPSAEQAVTLTGITAGRQIISIYMDHAASPAAFVVRVERMDGTIHEQSGSFAGSSPNPSGQPLDLVIGQAVALAGRLGTHRYAGHRLISDIPSGVSAAHMLRYMRAEARRIAADSDPTLRRLAEAPAVCNVITSTSGAVDLVLGPDQHNYFFNLTSLTGEMTWNLPSAALSTGLPVTVTRFGGAEFDLVLNGTNLRMRKGESATVISDGTAWQVADDRNDLAQVRETANDFTLLYDRHAGKIAMATSGTPITCRLREASPTIATFWVGVEANASQRTITFAPAAGVDGDNVTIRNPGPFTVLADTPRLFLAYVGGNSDGSSAIYQVFDLGGGTAAAGGYVPLAFTLQTGTSDAPASGTWRSYNNAGAIAITLNATMADAGECVLEKLTGSGTITITPAATFTLNGTTAGRVLSGRVTVKRIGVNFVVDGAIPDAKAEPAIVTYAQAPVVPDNSFSLTKLATIGAQTFLGRLVGLGTGAVNALTPAQVITNLQGEPTDLYGQLSLPQSATGSQASAPSGRTWNLTGNVSAVPVTAGWHALYLNSSGSNKTITPVSGQCISTKTATLVASVTVANNEAVTVFGNGTNLWIMGDVV